MTDEIKAKIQHWLDLAGMFWDWFDARDVEKHLVAIFTLFIRYQVIVWSMAYASANKGQSGTDVAAVLAAINVPLSAFEAAVIKWYFAARTGTGSTDNSTSGS